MSGLPASQDQGMVKSPCVFSYAMCVKDQRKAHQVVTLVPVTNKTRQSTQLLFDTETLLTQEATILECSRNIHRMLPGGLGVGGLFCHFSTATPMTRIKHRLGHLVQKVMLHVMDGLPLGTRVEQGILVLYDNTFRAMQVSLKDPTAIVGLKVQVDAEALKLVGVCAKFPINMHVQISSKPKTNAACQAIVKDLVTRFGDYFDECVVTVNGHVCPDEGPAKLCDFAFYVPPALPFYAISSDKDGDTSRNTLSLYMCQGDVHVEAMIHPGKPMHDQRKWLKQDLLKTLAIRWMCLLTSGRGSMSSRYTMTWPIKHAADMHINLSDYLCHGESINVIKDRCKDMFGLRSLGEPKAKETLEPVRRVKYTPQHEQATKRPTTISLEMLALIGIIPICVAVIVYNLLYF